ncbi:hypothetical protein [Archangium violaceum]|uniref:hypothetical protein n=1 Tax=Archangium violaceum TaxID=83451 RepID=UPI0036DCF82A
MKRLLTVGILCISASAFAQDKTAPKPTTPPKTETKAGTKTETKAPESKDLKVEEPDQKEPKNKEVETKAQGEVKKDSF